jgi:hypothetical protein
MKMEALWSSEMFIPSHQVIRCHNAGNRIWFFLCYLADVCDQFDLIGEPISYQMPVSKWLIRFFFSTNRALLLIRQSLYKCASHTVNACLCAKLHDCIALRRPSLRPLSKLLVFDTFQWLESCTDVEEFRGFEFARAICASWICGQGLGSYDPMIAIPLRIAVSVVHTVFPSNGFEWTWRQAITLPICLQEISGSNIG